MRREKGITLVALIITIIILVILVGITVNTLFNKGIIENSQTAVSNYALKQAEEKLTAALVGAKMEKYKNTAYNENAYLTNYIINETGATVDGNTVILDGYVFEIDRSVPKIKMVIGKGQKEEKIEITSEVKAEAPFEKATITVSVKSEEEIKRIVLNGEGIEITANGELYTGSIEVTSNGIYNVIVYTQSDKYNYSTIKVEDVAEDMIIKTPEELVAFRNKVNSGATFEGKTITLASDIDLSSICSREKGSWEPIGNNTYKFKGRFNGNGKIINHLYINNTNDYQGLFGYVSNGTITRVVIGSDSKINAASNTGALSGCIENTNIYECVNKSEVKGANCVGGIVGRQKKSTIRFSYNKGTIIGNNDIGGISGRSAGKSQIGNSYNSGEIIAIDGGETSLYSRIGGVVGIIGTGSYMDYCYNVGKIDNQRNNWGTGGVCGESNSWKTSSFIETEATQIIKCYNSGAVRSSGTEVGGILGINNIYCKVKDSYVSDNITISYNSINATENIDTSENYVGKIIGYTYSTDTTYINNIGTLSTMPTVYNVVNGLSDEESSYWSNTNLNEPKLLWEK